MKNFSNLKIGDTLSLGTFEKDGKTGTEKLTWQVLSVEDHKALVITTQGIDCQLYNTEAIETDWQRCSLRNWLNGKFLSEAFTAEEAAYIITTEVLPEENPSHRGDPGKATQDKLFLLSISQAETYFFSDEQRLCKPTSLAIENRVYTDDTTGSCAWWLRNQGSSAERAALVDEFGSVNHNGDGVYCDGTAVRPAMWINLS